MLEFIMKKILLISLMFLFQTNLIAKLEGQGKIELSAYSVEQFEKYLDTKNHNKNAGAFTNATGLVFSISGDATFVTDLNYYQEILKAIGMVKSINSLKNANFKNHDQL